MNNVIHRLKLLVKSVANVEQRPKPDIVCEVTRLGSDYGGWDVVTCGLTPRSVVYSFGVGEDASFDKALIEKCNLTIHAFDPTPKSIEWVRQQKFSDQFVMHEYGVASIDGVVSFYPPENPDHVSHTIIDRPSTKSAAIAVSVKRVSTIMQELGHAHIDLLKMDIEGAEYDVIQDMYNSNIRPGQMLIEFHHRFPGVGISKTKNATKCIRKMGYRLFSVSDAGQEYCYIRVPN